VVIGTRRSSSNRRLVCAHPHDAARLVPNLNGCGRSEVGFRPLSHVIVCLGNEAIRFGDVIVLV
jgi:hypothetical protein